MNLYKRTLDEKFKEYSKFYCLGLKSEDIEYPFWVQKIHSFLKRDISAEINK